MIGQQALFRPDPGLPLRRRVDLIPADTARAARVIKRYHYLHRARTMHQLAYWVRLDGDIIGVILYAYPMCARELYGYHPGEIVEFARFYLSPNVPHVASCAIAQSLRRLRRDWAAKFPEASPIKAVIAYADSTRHRGTIYRAAGFRYVGTTTPTGGIARRGRGHADYHHPKLAFLKDLKELP